MLLCLEGKLRRHTDMQLFWEVYSLTENGLRMYATVHFHHGSLVNVFQAETSIRKFYKNIIKNGSYHSNYLFLADCIYT